MGEGTPDRGGRDEVQIRGHLLWTVQGKKRQLLKGSEDDLLPLKDDVPHGDGKFLYPNGDVEDVVMEDGVRHGQSLYKCQDDGTVEEVMFWEGQPRGPSKVKPFNSLTKFDQRMSSFTVVVP